MSLLNRRCRRGLCGSLLGLHGCEPVWHRRNGERVRIIVFDIVDPLLQGQALLRQVVVLALEKDFKNAVNLIVGQIRLAEDVKDVLLDQFAQNGCVLNRVLVNLGGEHFPISKEIFTFHRHSDWKILEIKIPKRAVVNLKAETFRRRGRNFLDNVAVRLVITPGEDCVLIGSTEISQNVVRASFSIDICHNREKRSRVGLPSTVIS